jgi:hypothetical protein
MVSTGLTEKDAKFVQARFLPPLILTEYFSF